MQERRGIWHAFKTPTVHKQWQSEMTTLDFVAGNSDAENHEEKV
jgi:hypothetical protein